MRKKFKALAPLIALLIVFVFVGLSFAVTREATFGFKNSSNVYRLTATRDTSGAYINVSPTGVGITPGYEVFTTAAATNNLDASDSGRRLIAAEVAPAGGSHYILPQAIAGLEIELCTGTQVTATLDTHSTNDIINHTISGTALDAGDSLKSSGQAGDCIRVTCGSDTNWYITNMGAAAWSDNSTN